MQAGCDKAATLLKFGNEQGVVREVMTAEGSREKAPCNTFHAIIYT